MEIHETQKKKPRFLCLHGFRTSAEILKKQLGRWPDMVLERLDLVFLDGPYPALGQSDVESFYDPPYFEWFQFRQDFQEYHNFEECLAYIEDYMINHGPFDGLLGFSQGAIMSAALPGMQLDGVALTKVPKIKFLMIISGAKLGGSKLISGGKYEGSKFGLPKMAANAFSSPVKCPSLHIIGETDFLKEPGTELLESFEEPFVIHHPKGHTIARLASNYIWKMDYQLARKPRFLCFHGFGTSGKILEKELQQWPEFVREKMDLVCIDAPFPAEGKSPPEGKFDPPYYEWFQSNEDYSEYMNFDECVAYIEDCMTKIGPFDGLLGFSQGALLSAALPGMQTEGVALTRVPKIKCVIIISGGKFGGSKFSSPKLAEKAFSSPIECPSLHFIGEKDIAKPYAIELLDSFVDPFVIYHHEGHAVPKLDEKGLEVMLSFLEKIQKLL